MSELALRNAVEKIKAICDESGGRSQFFPWGGSGYKASVTHYYESSTELSHAAIHPGSAEDLQEIVKVIAETRVPFAVKCGGHNSNPGFSSTKGIQIFLARFNKITVHESEKLVDVGAGCLFGELYRALEPYSLNIVGGSGLAGIGVAGWLLGGGYSTKTSQYGLGIDNIKSVKIVLPDGSLKEASASQNKDLFFAIKGGGNNFGIVTEFTLKAHVQERDYYDFALIYKERHYNAVRRAIADFINKADEKASLSPAFRSQNTLDGIKNALTVSCAYDGCLEFVDDPFKGLTAIEHTIQNFGTEYPPRARTPSDAQAHEFTTRTKTSAFYTADALHSWARGTHELSDLLEDPRVHGMYGAQFSLSMSRQIPHSRLIPARVITERPMPGISQYPRARWGTMMVDRFTPEIIEIIEEEQKGVAEMLNERDKGGRRADISFWTFTETMFDNAKPAAWPHEQGQPNCPVTVYFTWEGNDNDTFWIETMKTALRTLRDRIYSNNPSLYDLPYFINSALAEDTHISDIYRDNLERLGLLRWQYDPHDVMGLTGGFRIPIINHRRR